MSAIAAVIEATPWIAGGLLASFVTWKVVRFVRGDAGLRRSMLLVARIHLRWRREARMIGLTVTDPAPTFLDRIREDRRYLQRGCRVRYPRLRIRSDRYGVTVRTKTLPGLGLDEWQRAARHLADAWGCVRVAVTRPRPGRIQIRAVRVDPLTETLTWVPDGSASGDLRRVELGVDEYAAPVHLRLDGVSGVGIYGLPGYGKTSLILSLIARLAPSPAVQLALIDGKGGGDYEDLAPRIFTFTGDDLAAANAALRRLVELRERRAAVIRQVLGVRNLWQVGPSPAWPLVVIVIDEAHTFFAQIKDGGDKELKRRNSMAAQNALFVEDLVKKGRSVGILTILTTQKGTADAIPTSIRDVCAVSVSFAARTEEAAVAALGADIRQYPEASPVALQDPVYIGVASMVVAGRPGFTRFRCPLVEDADVARICRESAGLTADPMRLLEEQIRPRLVSQTDVA